MKLSESFDVRKRRYSTVVSAYTAKVFAERNMVDEVTIWRPAEPVLLSYDGKLMSQVDIYVYEGPARVWNVQGPLTMGIGDEPTYYSQTFCSIPLSYPDPFSNPTMPIPESPRVDDIVQIFQHRDPLMLDRFFRVVDVEAGGLLPACRRMQLVGIQASKQWGPDSIPTEWVIR